MSFAAYPPDRYAGPGGEASAWVRTAATPPELSSSGGTETHYLATGAQTGGDFGLYRWEMGPRRSGPDPHFHRSISESFYVLGGAVRLHDGNRWRDAGPGDFLHVPPDDDSSGGVDAVRTQALASPSGPAYRSGG